MSRTEPVSVAEIGRQLDQLARRERGRLIAGLVARLGPRHLQLAEDVAQEALLAALATWPYRGVPDNPAAWLTRVARNKALDRLRHENREQPYDADLDQTRASDGEVDMAGISDPELELIFLSCHPALEAIDQLALTLRIVSGFTAGEIAELLLSTEAAVAQRLSRAKRRLKALDIASFDAPTVFERQARVPAVLKVIYLMFSLGYAPRSGARLIRRDVAMEALRLAAELSGHQRTATPAAHALAALLCFQVSRFDAREDDQGRPVLLRDQNPAHWDRGRIAQGMDFLASAKGGTVVSRYHLEAAIASVYATAPSWARIDWQSILSCHERLAEMTDSPVVAISACVALAFAGRPGDSLARLDDLGQEFPVLRRYAPYHIARAEVLRLLGNEAQARASFNAALDSGTSTPVAQHLELRLGATA